MKLYEYSWQYSKAHYIKIMNQPTIAVFNHIDIKITIDDIRLLLEAITKGM
jgi:hypothetical protein